MECVNFLRTTQIYHAIRPKKIVTIDTTTSLEDILQLFDDNGIVAAPVFDPNTNKVIAVLDMMDIVDFIINFVGLQISDIQHLLNSNPRKFFEILECCGSLFSESPAINIIANRSNKLLTIRENDTCLSVVESMNEKITRLFIVDHNSTIVNLVSQSDILSIIAQNIHILEDMRSKTINQSGLLSVRCKPYTADTRVINILHDMLNVKDYICTAVPIVDSNKKLIANFSISNLKGLTKSNFSELMLPVVDYLQFQNIKEKNQNLTCLKEKNFHPLTVFAWDTLESAIFKIVATKVHRLWVVDIDGYLVSMVTIDAILKLITYTRMEIAQ